VRRTFGYAATTKDAAQRSIRTFYEAVKKWNFILSIMDVLSYQKNCPSSSHQKRLVTMSWSELTSECSTLFGTGEAY
jgi:hypothetical protein